MTFIRNLLQSFIIVISCQIVSNIIFADKMIDNSFEVRKITPPNLNRDHIGQRITCSRPVRSGGPAMNIEEYKGKIVANNYGHGGSGWSLALGSAKYVIGLLSHEMSKKGMTKDEPIAVIGAGVLGLFNALELVNQGYKNVTIIADQFHNLTSHNAGGELAPSFIDSSPETRDVMEKIGMDSYAFYKGVALHKNKNIEDGTLIISSYYPSREASHLEPYVANKVMSPAKDVVLDFQNGTMRRMVVYDDAIFMDTGKLMTLLTKYLSKHVTFKEKKIYDIMELDEMIIVNCTGNGAKALMHDNKMTPAQGHY